MRNATILTVLLTAVVAAEPLDPLANGLGADIRSVAGSRWSIDDGTLIPVRGEERTYVVTSVRYADVEITLDVHPEAGTNSGVFTRCQDPDEITPEICYEFNIWDAHPDQASRTGAIVTLAAPTTIVDTEDQWNALRIRVEGPRLQYWVNDTLVNDIEDDKLAEGFIALQYGGEQGMVRFRNLRIEELH